MTQHFRLCVQSPLGPLTLRASESALLALDWHPMPDSQPTEIPLLNAARVQLDAYFAGRLHHFTIPLAPVGTDFQRRAWAALSAIPYGAVRTYGAVARHLATAPRALAGACARNPIAIIVPCHRVVARSADFNAGLGGYSGAGGPETKRFLLALEDRVCSAAGRPGTRRARTRTQGDERL